AGVSCAPPLLETPSEITVLDGNLTLRCVGHHLLQWTYPDEDIAEYADISNSPIEKPQEKTKFESILHIAARPTDTGRYTCRYQSNHSLADDTYVFVHSTHNGTESNGLFYRGSSNMLYVYAGSELVVPCLTTLPNITVTLTHQQQNITDLFIWDARQGFSKANATHAESGEYLCTSEGYHSVKVQITVEEPPSTIASINISSRLKTTVKNPTINKKLPSSQTPQNATQDIFSSVTFASSTVGSFQEDITDSINFGLDDEESVVQLAKREHRVLSPLLRQMITIKHIVPSDTGRYSCFYKNNPHRRVSTYVFIHRLGYKQVFLLSPVQRSVNVIAGYDLVIGCRTTLPNVTVIVTHNKK
ncbi:unnamed protein product, partial [Meganyctiphanes norvegica]